MAVHQVFEYSIIRASVDALYRDGMDVRGDVHK